MKKVVKLTENELKGLIKESIKMVLREDYDFASIKPQYDINSPEYRNNYDSMQNTVKSNDKEHDNRLMDLQIAHHNNLKGDHTGLNLKPSKRQYKKYPPYSIETIITNVLRALNRGDNPENIPNFERLNGKTEKYIYDRYGFASHIRPVGIICDTYLVVYNDNTDEFEADDDEVIEL